MVVDVIRRKFLRLLFTIQYHGGVLTFIEFCISRSMIYMKFWKDFRTINFQL